LGKLSPQKLSSKPTCLVVPEKHFKQSFGGGKAEPSQALLFGLCVLGAWLWLRLRFI